MFVVEYYVIDSNNELYNPCGSIHCVIIHDLKTLRGVKNRIAKYPKPANTKEIRIYNVSNLFDRETYRQCDVIYQV